MRLVLFAEDGLNVAACDRLLARLAEDRAREAPQITIDLRQAAYVEPYGVACMVLIVRQLAQHRKQVVCVLPSNVRAQQTMVRLGLTRWLQPRVELRNLNRPEGSEAEEGALPLSAIRSRADVQVILAYLMDMARRRLGYDTGDLLDATKVVSELCHNVVDHSEAEGLATAQIFRDREGRRFVSLAVVDGGVGIRASLGRRHPDAVRWTHAEAIQRALGGLSSRADKGGMGLRSVHTVVRRYQGRLAIRSGDGRLYVSAGRQPRTIAGVPFSGTQVGISFSQR